MELEPLIIKLTQEELQQLQKIANDAGVISVSDFAKQKLLALLDTSKGENKADAPAAVTLSGETFEQVVFELSRLHQELRTFVKESSVDLDEEAYLQNFKNSEDLAQDKELSAVNDSSVAQDRPGILDLLGAKDSSRTKDPLQTKDSSGPMEMFRAKDPAGTKDSSLFKDPSVAEDPFSAKAISGAKNLFGAKEPPSDEQLPNVDPMTRVSDSRIGLDKPNAQSDKDSSQSVGAGAGTTAGDPLDDLLEEALLKVQAKNRPAKPSRSASAPKREPNLTDSADDYAEESDDKTAQTSDESSNRSQGDTSSQSEQSFRQFPPELRGNIPPKKRQ
jgi:hypothetical protein